MAHWHFRDQALWRKVLAFLATVAAVSASPPSIGVASEPPTLAVLDLDYVDTSGEPSDQTASHERRSNDFVSALRGDLAASGKYRIVALTCGAGPCASGGNAAEIKQAAEAAGVELVAFGAVHKLSTLIEWVKIDVVDERENRVVLDRLLTFRGDNDEAWQRAEGFAARQILESLR